MASRFINIDPAPWARNANYPSSLNPWSATPVRVAPSSTVAAAGVAPQDQLPAQFFNYQIGVVGDALNSAAIVTHHAALTNWGHVTIGVSAPSFIVPLPAPNGVNATALRPKILSVLGAGGGFAIATATPDGKSFDLTPTVASFGGFACIAGDDAGSLFGGLTTAAYKFSSDRGVTWSNFTPGTSNPLDAVYYTGARYVVLAQGDTCTSTALGGGWATSAGTAWGGITQFARQLVGNRIAGSTATVLVLMRVVGATSNYSSYYSTDAGVNWTLGHDFGNTVTVQLVWSEAWGLFVAVTSAGALWTSPDGATWTLQKTASAFSAAGTKNLIAACGFAIACVSNRVTGTAVDNCVGVAYTLDLGATWYETYFGDLTHATAGSVAFLTSANGRLYACDTARIYVSGLLETPGSANYLGS